MEDKQFYSVAEAGHVLALGKSSLYELMRGGQLAFTTFGRKRLITAESLRRFAHELTLQGKV